MGDWTFTCLEKHGFIKSFWLFFYRYIYRIYICALGGVQFAVDLSKCADPSQNIHERTDPSWFSDVTIPWRQGVRTWGTSTLQSSHFQPLLYWFFVTSRLHPPMNLFIRHFNSSIRIISVNHLNINHICAKKR